MKTEPPTHPAAALEMDEDEVLEWLDFFYLQDPHYHNLSRVDARLDQMLLYYMLLYFQTLRRLTDELIRNPPVLNATELSGLMKDHKPLSIQELAEKPYTPSPPMIMRQQDFEDLCAWEKEAFEEEHDDED